MPPSSRRGSALLTFAVVVLACLALYQQFGYLLPGAHRAYVIENAAPGVVASENHYSPGENLERIDVDRLATAQKSVDIAMYAFTDKYLAEGLLQLAHKGVVIRIYRDHEQWDSEERNAEKYRDQSTTQMFQGEPNIHVRIKESGRRDLMHLKAYAIDSKLLRDGSANWSAAGLKVQDNNAHFTNDPAQIKAYEAAFEEMWTRGDNRELQ